MRGRAGFHIDHTRLGRPEIGSPCYATAACERRSAHFARAQFRVLAEPISSEERHDNLRHIAVVDSILLVQRNGATLMLSNFERYPLTFGPTPIERLSRLTAHLGGDVEIFAKREDCNSGLAFGGNKLRKPNTSCRTRSRAMPTRWSRSAVCSPSTRAWWPQWRPRSG